MASAAGYAALMTSTSNDPITDPFLVLEAEHREVEQMLQRLADDPSEAERDQLVEQLQLALSTHMTFEETQVYPLMAELDDELEEEAEAEHSLAREGLAQLVSMAGQPGFGAAVEMLMAGIQHHVEEEENEAFPKLRESVDAERREALVTTLLEGRRAAGLPDPDPSLATGARSSGGRSSGGASGDLDEMSKEDLMEMAREREIEGRSSMTKAELVKALKKG